METNNGNPYLNSKRLWNGVYESLEDRLHYTQMIVVILSLVIVVAIGAVVFMATRSHIKPYVLALRDNELVTVDELTSDLFEKLQPKIAVSLCKSFLEHVRNVSLDPAVNHENHIKAIAMVTGSATSLVQRHLATKESNNHLIQLEINTVLMKSQHAIELRWRETARDKVSGATVSTASYSAELIYEFSSVSLDPVISSHNPMGFYIRDCAWTEELTLS